MIRKKREVLLLALVFLFLVFLSFTSRNSEASEINIQRLTQEAPYFDAYPGAQGLVWLREQDYSLLPDGRMERISKWAILARRGISDNWLKWNIVLQQGEEMEVIEAAIYDPGTYSLVAPVIPRSRELPGGLTLKEIHFPEIQEEFLMVLVIREKLAKDCRLDDFLWLALDIPLWEQKISVTLPKGSDFHYFSNYLDAPVLTEEGVKQKYYWNTLDMSPWLGRSIVENARPSLLFSTRKGEDAFFRDLSMLQNSPLPELPTGLSSIASKGNNYSVLEEFLATVEDLPVLEQVPSDLIRSSIPGTGPWTRLEKMLALSGWLERSGWDNRILWNSRVEIRADTPDSPAVLGEPVLDIETGRGLRFYYVLDQGVPLGEIAPSLWGKTLYSTQGDHLEKLAIPRGKASDHKIVVRWDLELGSDGVMSGDMETVILNAWNELFFAGIPSDQERIRTFLANWTEADLEGPLEIEYLANGLRIRSKVYFNSALMNGQNMLVRVPYFYIPQIPEMSSAPTGSGLAYPFAAEQTFEITFPEGMKLIALPNTLPKEGDGISLKENFTLNRKKQIVKGAIKLVSGIERVDENNRSLLLDSLRSWVIWADKSLPFIIE